MMLLVRHQTSYAYGAGASRVAMLLRLKPRNHDGQRVLDWAVTVNDEPVETFMPNGYGDLEALWIRHGQAAGAVIVATGLVETIDRNGIVSGLAERIDPRVFLRETPLTAASSAVRALADDLSGDTLGRLHALSERVNEAIAYRPGVTGPDTTAAQALALGAGVCQDHAQLFIAGARAMGVPARYVAGYLRAQDQGMELHETHGWAEALVPGLGWIGFDPSNRVCVTEDYVRLASGLDAHDAAPVRGSAMAAGTIAIDADVRIAQAHEDAQEQQLQRQQQQQPRDMKGAA